MAELVWRIRELVLPDLRLLLLLAGLLEEDAMWVVLDDGQRIPVTGRLAKLVLALLNSKAPIDEAQHGRWSVVWNGQHCHSPRLEITLGNEGASST